MRPGQLPSTSLLIPHSIIILNATFSVLLTSLNKPQINIVWRREKQMYLHLYMHDSVLYNYQLPATLCKF
jgi:hypothetical protein